MNWNSLITLIVWSPLSSPFKKHEVKDQSDGLVLKLSVKCCKCMEDKMEQNSDIYVGNFSNTVHLYYR